MCAGSLPVVGWRSTIRGSPSVLVDTRARLAASARPDSLRSRWLRLGRLGWSGCGGCCTPPRCMTRWPPWTRSRFWARRCGACSRWPMNDWRPSCECSPAPRTTPAWPSHRSTGTTRRHERRWWMRAPGMPVRCSGSCMAARWRQGWPGYAAAPRWGPGPAQAGDGSFRIARKVTADRVISVVDPDARHGHKTSARGFDGYKGHASVDPDSELIMATAATAGNISNAAAAPGLLAELVDQVQDTPLAATAASGAAGGPPAPTVYGDSAYGSGPLLASLHTASIDPPSRSSPLAPRGHFTKEQFQIDLAAGTVTCPAQHTAPISTTPIQATATTARPASSSLCELPASGPVHQRDSQPHHHHHRLRAGSPCPRPPGRPRPRRRLPRTRPKVERKLAHLSAAATAAAACGSAVLSRWPPTSTCWPPRSTWPGWACSVRTGPYRVAGQQHDQPACPPPAAVHVDSARHPRPADSRYRVLLPCGRQHARPLAALSSMARFTPAT